MKLDYGTYTPGMEGPFLSRVNEVRRDDLLRWRQLERRVAALEDAVSSYWVQHAISSILDEYSATVLIAPTTTFRMGVNDDIDTGATETVMTLPGTEAYETYVGTNAIDTMSSSNASDTQSVTIIGHTISGGNFTRVTQTATLNGQNKVTLSTPLARVESAYPAQNTFLLGTVYIYENGTISSGVPTTNSDVHIMVTQANNQSVKAATTLPSDEYGLITSLQAAIKKTTIAGIDVSIQVRESGGFFRKKFETSLSSNGTTSIMTPLEPYIIVPPNADVIVMANTDTANTAVIAGFNMLHAKVQ